MIETSWLNNEKRRILAQVIPEIQCPSDCSLCCEIGLSWTWEPENFRVVDYEFNSIETTSCDMLGPGGGCSVYDMRRVICRLFFKIEGLFPCPQGLEPEGGMLPPKMVEDILWCWLSESATVNDAKAVRARWRRYERS
jgi:hypothetical protein